MGSYAEMWLESLYVGSTKNDFDPPLMQLFRASDKRQVRGSQKDLPFQMRRWMEHVDDEFDELTVVYYTAPARTVRDRLELKGYTLETAKAAFLKCIRGEAASYRRLEHKETAEFYKPVVALLEALDADRWMEALSQIRDAGPARPESQHLADFDGTLVGYMLARDWYGYPESDLYVPLRLALETCSENESLIYDLTELVGGGYFSAEDDFVSMALDFSAGEHTSSSKIIVLTEGRSDRWIISESIKVLYPHLYDYFTFMDFEAARIEGGAGPLAGMVKSFAGAGIVNKVIAIFDNDTAGESAVRTLRNVKLPSNICAIQLPAWDALANYPTIGPSGTANMDVNGMAASIELYLGHDVLSEGGRLTAVQWTGYNTLLGKYQDEVLNKDRIHERFREKLRVYSKCSESANSQHWAGIQKILSCVFSAFHRFDRELIFAALDDN